MTKSREDAPAEGRAHPGRKPRVKAAAPGPAFQPAKETIARAAEALGGHERLAQWAREDAKNESVFWSSIYPKLIPVQLSGEGGGPVEHGVIVKFV
ncbi:MAG TPA: hypothetical protein VFW19_01245 [Allosphingosinicella sp.]|nr:hypothetical protein [Allosphingosinicella sp.]